MDPVVQKILEHGIVASLMAVAVWWLARKNARLERALESRDKAQAALRMVQEKSNAELRDAQDKRLDELHKDCERRIHEVAVESLESQREAWKEVAIAIKGSGA